MEASVVLCLAEPWAEAFSGVGVKSFNWAIHSTFERILLFLSFLRFSSADLFDMVLNMVHNTRGTVVEARFCVVFWCFGVPPWACAFRATKINFIEGTVLQALRHIMILIFMVMFFMFMMFLMIMVMSIIAIVMFFMLMVRFGIITGGITIIFLVMLLVILIRCVITSHFVISVRCISLAKIHVMHHFISVASLTNLFLHTV